MHSHKIFKLIQNSDQFLPGKRHCFLLSIAAILARGNVLLEDLPGVGKTTLVKFLGKGLGLNISRIQFTNDLLPSDIIGTTVYDKERGDFRFHPGPIFGELVLADELNRAPPKTQSALLQAMEEKVLTVDRTTHSLPPIFTVFATQNPMGQHGTFPLPESQLDRFTVKFHLGNLDKSSTISILKSGNIDNKLQAVPAVLNADELLQLQQTVESLHVDEDLFAYIFRLLDYSRHNSQYLPLSNRCGVDLVRVSRAWAYLQQRDYVIPDDIQAVFPYVAGHRLSLTSQGQITAEQSLAYQILDQVPVRE